MMDVSQLTAESSAPVGGKRRGRKAKAAPAEQKPKRKYTRRKPLSPVTPPAARAYAIFLGEDGLQLAPTGGGRSARADLRRRARDRGLRRAPPLGAGVVTA